MELIWQCLMDHGFDRQSAVVNLGGGMITDLGGFVAATYKRGIDFFHIPTTLLAMVDAAIGGKTGINYGVVKNQLGTITLPKATVIDTEFLKTLSDYDLKTGLAEVFKHGLISDRTLWEELGEIENFYSVRSWDAIIEKAVAVKVNIVEKDPTEKGMRKLLNFGHTIGHALESHLLETNRKISHGHAVALGMMAETHLSANYSGLSSESTEEIFRLLKKHYEIPSFSFEDIDALTALLRHDKKNVSGAFRFTLLEDIGKGVIDVEVSTEDGKEAIEFLNSVR